MRETQKEPKYNLGWAEDDWIKAATELESGTIVRDWFDEGLRCIIMRGPASFNAYIGVPETHPLAGFGYDEISSAINCHGGLTFASKGDGIFPPGFYWYGWDYAHCGDRSFYDVKYPETRSVEPEKEWTIKDIKPEVGWTVNDFKSLMKFTEKIISNYENSSKINQR